MTDMSNKKNIGISIAFAMLLAACGGGDPATSKATDSSQLAPSAGNTDAANDNASMTGSLLLAGDQVVFYDGLRQREFDMSTFASTAVDGGVYGMEPGPDSPTQLSGFRVMPEGMGGTTGQSKRVRVAIDLTDTATGSPQIFQMMIDQVDIAVSANNAMIVSVPATAKAHIYMKLPLHGTRNLTVPNLPSDIVRLTPIEDNPTSQGLVIDIAKAMARARAYVATEMEIDMPETVWSNPAHLRRQIIIAYQGAMAQLSTFQGKFTLKGTISNVKLQRPGPLGTNVRIDSVGESITINGSDQAPVTGGGVKGTLFINTLPPGI